jgi:hypothetical protein
VYYNKPTLAQGKIAIWVYTIPDLVRMTVSGIINIGYAQSESKITFWKQEYDITDILLKVALNTITPSPK